MSQEKKNPRLERAAKALGGVAEALSKFGEKEGYGKKNQGGYKLSPYFMLAPDKPKKKDED